MISFDELVDDFEYILSSTCSEMIITIWMANPLLKTWYSGGKVDFGSSEQPDIRTISFDVLLKGFKSILGQHHTEIIKGIWKDNVLLHTWFSGQEVNAGTAEQPDLRRASPEELVSFFKSVVSSQQTMIIKRVWNSNENLYRAIAALDFEEARVLLRKVMTSALRCPTVVADYLKRVNNIKLLEAVRDDINTKTRNGKLPTVAERKIVMLNHRIKKLTKGNADTSDRIVEESENASAVTPPIPDNTVSRKRKQAPHSGSNKTKKQKTVETVQVEEAIASRLKKLSPYIKKDAGVSSVRKMRVRPGYTGDIFYNVTLTCTSEEFKNFLRGLAGLLENGDSITSDNNIIKIKKESQPQANLVQVQQPELAPTHQSVPLPIQPGQYQPVVLPIMPVYAQLQLSLPLQLQQLKFKLEQDTHFLALKKKETELAIYQLLWAQQQRQQQNLPQDPGSAQMICVLMLNQQMQNSMEQQLKLQWDQLQLKIRELFPVQEPLPAQEQASAISPAEEASALYDDIFTNPLNDGIYHDSIDDVVIEPPVIEQELAVSPQKPQERGTLLPSQIHSFFAQQPAPSQQASVWTPSCPYRDTVVAPPAAQPANPGFFTQPEEKISEEPVKEQDLNADWWENNWDPDGPTEENCGIQ